MFKDIYLFLKCLYGKKMINSLIYENHVFCTKGLFVRTCSNFLRTLYKSLLIDGPFPNCHIFPSQYTPCIIH